MATAGAAAGLYAVGSLQIKRSMQAGVPARLATAAANLAMALWSLPLVFLFGGDFVPESWLIAVLAGAALFAGRILSVKALEVGDLSIVGPLLGLKTILVACFAFATGLSPVTPWLWAAVVLVTLGVALLQRGPARRSARRRIAGLYAGGASVLFALCDILVVDARQHLGLGWLATTLFVTVALLTPLLGWHRPPPAQGRAPLLWGAAVMGFQTFLVVLLIGITGEAVLINIVYATRALWTVVADRHFGRFSDVHSHYHLRMAGAVMVVAAIVIVVFQR